MNTLFPEPAAVKRRIGTTDVAVLHRLGCRACPLAQLSNKHPDMPATGAAHPLVYILGEAPGKDEDAEGKQFVGASGQLLRPGLPRKFRDKIRFNNVVRTRPFKNETPSDIAIEACRPSIVRDIEQSKPKAIFGFGDVPLRWVSGFHGITLWRGRKMPVRVGSHTCWYYPMLHPAYLIYKRRDGKPSEEERMFGLDLKHAFAEVESLPKPAVHTPQDVFRNIECITDGGVKGLRQVEAALKWAMEQSDIGVDYETDRLRPYDKGSRILTVAIANGEKGFAFPIDHPEAAWDVESRERVCDLWVDFIRHAKGRKWVHTLAFELEWTAVKFGEKLVRAGQWEDTAAQACILDERTGRQKPGCFSLEFLVQQWFGFNLKKLSNLDRARLAAQPLEVVLRYNGGDARYHCLLGLKQREAIEEIGLQEAYGLALRRVPTVVLTQIKGIPIDQDEVDRLHKKYTSRIAKLRKEMFSLPVVSKFEKVKGHKFIPFSNPDALFLFKDMLKQSECKVLDKFTGDYKYSVDEEVLAKIDHPLADLLVKLRKANKQKSTYIDPLQIGPNSVLFEDELSHATFNTIFAETGRLSAEGPNWQNFPKRDGEAKEVRKQVKAPPGCVVMAFDYGQIEARVIAMFTKDKVFCKALWEKYDVHMEWAERLARAYPARIGGKKNLTDKSVMKEFRTDIKNQWTFPLFFGSRMESAADYLKMPHDVVRPLYNEFWRIFSGVKTWQEELTEFYREYGYVACLTKRRRRGPLSLNQLINAPVQGTAAEIVLDGMCRLSELGDSELQPEINIHDDLTYCRVPLKRVDAIAEIVIKEMLDVPFKWVNVPITVEMSVGDDWLNMDDAGTFSSDTWFKNA